MHQSRSCIVFAAGYHRVENGPRKLGGLCNRAVLIVDHRGP